MFMIPKCTLKYFCTVVSFPVPVLPPGSRKIVEFFRFIWNSKREQLDVEELWVFENAYFLI